MRSLFCMPRGLCAITIVLGVLNGAGCSANAGDEQPQDGNTGSVSQQGASSDDDASDSAAVDSDGKADLFSRRKRDYCCLKYGTSVYDGQDVLVRCKNIRDYRDEVGHVSAQVKCKGFSVSMSGDGMPGVGFGDPKSKLERGNCGDREDCARAGTE